MPPRIRVLLNPAAGAGSALSAGDLSDRIRAAGLEAEVRACPPARIPDAAGAAVQEGIDIVGIAGGDGSVRAVAEALMGSDAAIAVLPLGTLNHYARRLGLGELDLAIEALRDPRVLPQPAGIAGGRVFLNTATVGVYADVVRRRERVRRYVGKWPGAGIAFLATLARVRHRRITLQLEGETVECRTPLLWIGVGRGSFPDVVRSSDARGPEPTLELAVVQPASRLALAAFATRLTWRLLREQPWLADPTIRIRHATRVGIRARHRVGMTLDGEVMPRVRELTVQIRPDAIRFVVP